ncbi:MAG: hypothetical protein IKP71_02390 [Candidatus Riflebacteria bacterium]|nr:hypothetical protein [Candidatus Riflebacteria bacterium]
MKKCDVYIKFVNSDSFDDNYTVSFSDILKHTESCADCSYDRKIREHLLETLSNQPTPIFPENLHELAMSSMDASEKDESDLEKSFGTIFINLLKPLEIAVPAACIVMLFFMIQLNSSNEYEIAQIEQPQSSSMQKIRIAEAKENLNEEGLQKISSEEVEDFLVKLDEFQRLHPESVAPNRYKNRNIRLVTDR